LSLSVINNIQWCMALRCLSHAINKRRHLLLPVMTVTNLSRSGGILFTTRDGRAVDNTRWSEKLIENWFLPPPPTFDAPVNGRGFHRNIAITFGTEKLEWWATSRRWKNLEEMFTRSDTINERDRQQDRRTERQTPHDGINSSYH